MDHKKIVPPAAVTVKRDQKLNFDNTLHHDFSVFKSEFKEYSERLYTGYKLQRHAQVILSHFLLKNSNYLKCSRVTLGGNVELKRNSKTFRAYFGGIVTCANPVFCPICSPRIMGLRCNEIKIAVHQWLREAPDNTCYMLTLTASHLFNDSAESLKNRFRASTEMFFSHRAVKSILNAACLIGRITAQEQTFSLVNGWHFHQHILFFCKVFDFNIDRLATLWLSCLRANDLAGRMPYALTLIEARSCDKYLTKISSEMALTNCKQGRGSGHFSPFQLLFESFNGENWAKSRFIELFQACSRISGGIRPLRWSKNLKSYFDIEDVTDNDISSGKVELNLDHWADFPGEIFPFLSESEKASLRLAASKNDRVSFLKILYFAYIRMKSKRAGNKSYLLPDLDVF